MTHWTYKVESVEKLTETRHNQSLMDIKVNYQFMKTHVCIHTWCDMSVVKSVVLYDI